MRTGIEVLNVEKTNLILPEQHRVKVKYRITFSITFPLKDRLKDWTSIELSPLFKECVDVLSNQFGEAYSTEIEPDYYVTEDLTWGYLHSVTRRYNKYLKKRVIMGGTKLILFLTSDEQLAAIKHLL